MSRSPGFVGLLAITVTAWTGSVACWLRYAFQSPLPTGLSRTLTLIALVSSISLVFAILARSWARGVRAHTVLLVVIAITSVAVHMVGIDHEIHDRYYHDEGQYRQHADGINRGELLRSNYIYPHFVFYADAYATWVASLFYPQILEATNHLLGVADWSTFCRLLARSWSSLLAGLCAVPAFLLASRFGGLLAAVVAGLLMGFSSVFAEGGHVHTNDMPAAFFAAVTTAIVGRLIDNEKWSDYLFAGIFAGLAAGSKYPAGVVAIAIIAVWIRWRLKIRNFTWSLFGSGAMALLVFLCTTPGLVLDAKLAFSATRTGILAGLHQYSGSGWVGVVRESNSLYYLDQLVSNFGVVALVAGLFGLFLITAPVRNRLVWLIPFPLLYLVLMISMNVAVERNIFPVLTPIAALVGIGIATLSESLAARLPRRGSMIRVVVVSASLVFPFATSIGQDIGFMRPSTRDEMKLWIEANLPRGARVLKEVYTPSVSRQGFQVFDTFWVGSYSVSDLRAQQLDFVIVADVAFNRFFDGSFQLDEDQEQIRLNYVSFLSEFELVHRIERGRFRRGPQISILKVPTLIPTEQEEDLGPAPFTAVHSPGSFAPLEVAPGRSFPTEMRRLALSQGAYSVRLFGLEDPVAYRLVSADNSLIATDWVSDPWVFQIEAKSSGLYFLYIYLRSNRLDSERRMELESVSLEPARSVGSCGADAS